MVVLTAMEAADSAIDSGGGGFEGSVMNKSYASHGHHVRTCYHNNYTCIDYSSIVIMKTII